MEALWRKARPMAVSADSEDGGPLADVSRPEVRAVIRSAIDRGSVRALIASLPRYTWAVRSPKTSEEDGGDDEGRPVCRTADRPWGVEFAKRSLMGQI